MLVLTKTMSKALFSKSPTSEYVALLGEPIPAERDDEIMRLWVRGALPDKDALGQLTPMLKRLARWAADKYGIKDQAEDIQQELALALLGDARKKWKPNQPISSYMAGWAWRIASVLSQSAAREQSFDELFDSSEAEYHRGDGDRAAMAWGGVLNEAIEDLTPEHAAMADINLATYQKALSSISVDALDQALMRLEPKRKDGRSCSYKKKLQTNERLKSLRESIGLNRPDMAAALGMPLFRYVALETGKIKTVPEDVYRQAEELANNASKRVKMGSQLIHLSMSQIVDLWCKQLGTSDAMVVAEKLGVSRRTMRRWLDDEYKPKHDVVMSYHLRIHDMAS